MTELHELSAREQARALARGDFSPLDLVDHYLDRIDALNPEWGAFITVTRERARDRAREVMRVGRGGAAGVPGAAFLWGLPSAEKDLWDRAGVATTHGSRAFINLVPSTSSELVENLDAAGTISLGKTNVPEFGLVAYTENQIVSPARNPWDRERGAGGSSGGAAVAVALGMLPVAPGSDGGGSIRIPAAACGLVGLKPSRGLVPGGTGLRGLAGLSTAGPIARSIRDAAFLLDGMTRPRGHIVDTGFALRVTPADEMYGALVEEPLKRLRVGFSATTPWDDTTDIVIAPDVLAAWDRARVILEESGHECCDAPLTVDGLPLGDAFGTIWKANAACIPLEGDVLSSLEPITRWLVEKGRAISARELAEALETCGRYEVSLIRQLQTVDVLVTPALATLPPRVGRFGGLDPEENFAEQSRFTPFTAMANIAGIPALTLPICVSPERMPVGIQLMGRPGAEALLLRVGAELEEAIAWSSWARPRAVM